MFKVLKRQQKIDDRDYWSFIARLSVLEDQRRRKAALERQRREQGQKALRQAQYFVFAAARLLEQAEACGVLDAQMSASLREQLGQVFEAIDEAKSA